MKPDRVLGIVILAVFMTAAARLLAGDAEAQDWPLILQKPQPYAFTHRSGTCGSTQTITSTRKEDGWLRAMAKATVGACCPRCRSLVYWHYVPTEDIKVAIDLTSYSFNVTDIDATNQGNGTATAEASLWLEVKDESSSKNEPFARHWVEKEWRSIAGWGWTIGGWNRQDEPMVVNLKANHTYQIRAALKAHATRGADCSSHGSKCEYGDGKADAEATINEVTLYPVERPWISLEFRGRMSSRVVEYDTWNAYEYLKWQAREEYYYDDKLYFIVSAGGYDETVSYVDVSMDGDSIMDWSSSGDELTGTLLHPDVLRLSLPDPEILEAWGGEWLVEVHVNPEVDERELVPCGTMFPVMPLFSDSTAVAACTTWAGITLDELYDRANWMVDVYGWTPLDSALADGWAWSVTDTAGVRFVGLPAPIALSELFTVGGLDYTEPTLQQVFTEIEARCRGIDASGPENPIVFTVFPQGENSYTDDRLWEVDAYVQGRGDNSHLSDADSVDLAMHVNFDFYPRYLGPFTGIHKPTAQNIYLGQNYPNPFNPSTKIEYTIREEGPVTLRVYDVNGRLVATLVDETKSAGVIHKAEWSGRDNEGNAVATGVYFYRLKTRTSVETKKMVLLK
jgi:hypothetical protein